MDTPTPTDTSASASLTQAKLRAILDALATFDPRAARPPIIESPAATAAEDVVQQGLEQVRGLRAFRESVGRDLEGVEKVRPGSCGA